MANTVEPTQTTEEDKKRANRVYGFKLVNGDEVWGIIGGTAPGSIVVVRPMKAILIQDGGVVGIMLVKWFIDSMADIVVIDDTKIVATTILGKEAVDSYASKLRHMDALDEYRARKAQGEVILDPRTVDLKEINHAGTA